MEPHLILTRALLAGAVVLLMVGVVAAWSSDHATKRVIGIVVALLGALVGLAALSAPSALLIAGVAVLFGHVAVGVALVVRLQEAYGGVEAPAIDAADAQSEPVERGG